MTNDLNVVNLIGRLTRDPEVKQLGGGDKSICKFSIANNRSYGGKESVSFFNCTCWGKGGEILAQYMRKGSMIAISGRLESRTWEGNDGRKQYATEIVVQDFQFLDGKKGGGEDHAPKGSGPAMHPTSLLTPDYPMDDDDIPF